MSSFVPTSYSLSLAALFSVGLLAFSGCAPQEADGRASLEQPASLSLSVSSGALIPAFSPDVLDYQLSSYGNLSPVYLTVRGATARVQGLDVKDGEPALLSKVVIRPDAVIPVEVATASGPVTYTLHLLPKDLPPYTYRDYGVTPGNLLVSPYSQTKSFTPYLLIIGTSGQVVYYRRLEKPGFDWKRSTLTNGETRYTFLSDGDLYVLNENFEDIGKYRLRSTAQHTAYAVDLHDVKMFEDDHYILLSYVDKMVTNVPVELSPASGGARVIAAMAQEVRGDQVVFEWDSSAHPELYALSTEGNNFAVTTAAADYAHLNSIDVDPKDGNWVMSFRHLDAVLKVSKKDGSVLWRLGNLSDNFMTTDAQKTSHQHFARFLSDGRLQVFDNGNADQASRVVRYGLDTERGRITSFDSLPLGYFARAMGSVDALDSRSVLVGLGAHRPGEPDVEELDLITGQPTYELSFAFDYYSYRAYKIQ